MQERDKKKNYADEAHAEKKETGGVSNRDATHKKTTSLRAGATTTGNYK